MVRGQETKRLLSPWQDCLLTGRPASITFPEVAVSLDDMASMADDTWFSSVRMITTKPLVGEDHSAEPFWTDTGTPGTRVTFYPPRVVLPQNLGKERINAPTVHQVGMGIMLYFWKTGEYLFQDQYVITSSYSTKWNRWALVCFRPDCGMFVTLHYNPPPGELIALHAE